MWVRGLKFFVDCIKPVCVVLSHPVWGAWIEMGPYIYYSSGPEGRTPCGVRGLKWDPISIIQAVQKVAPRVGAWIEMICNL